MDKPRLITRFLKKSVCSFLFRVEHINEEVLDEYPSYVIAPNHSTVLDPIFVFPVKYELDISIVAKKELFKYGWFRFLAKRFNTFAIDREHVDVRSMLKSIDVFKQNENAKLILFPEGKVVKTEEEAGKVYRKGAAFLAYHLEKPIIPVYITRRPHPFSKVKVTYGKPFFISKETFKGRDKFEEASKKIIENIYALRND